MKHIVLSLLVFPFFVSCAYNREEGCHLDKLNVSGNVTKIETVVESTMPLTELYYGSFDPSQAISMLGGNFVFEFDNYGDLKKMTGYGIDGEVLFISKQFNQSQEPKVAPSVIGVSAKQSIDKMETVSDSDGKIVNAKYYSGKDLIWNQSVTYNERGDVATIIKDYASLSIKSDFLNIQYADTTLYEYSSFDEQGNWTVANVLYKGVLSKHKHEYKVIRQISYDGESQKSSLIGQLKSINATKEHNENIDVDSVSIGNYGSMKIPHYMALQSKDYISSVNDFMKAPTAIDYLFMSVYDKSDAYATISVSRNYVGEGNGFEEATEEELSFSQELDDVLKEQNVEVMAQGGTYVLKWLPYRFVDISGKRSLKLSYYRYGKGSPIPVYCENYIIPMKDGYTLSIIYSFQSNLDNRFRKDFSNAINSIRFKQ